MGRCASKFDGDNRRRSTIYGRRNTLVIRPKINIDVGECIDKQAWEGNTKIIFIFGKSNFLLCFSWNDKDTIFSLFLYFYVVLCYVTCTSYVLLQNRERAKVTVIQNKSCRDHY